MLLACAAISGAGNQPGRSHSAAMRAIASRTSSKYLGGGGFCHLLSNDLVAGDDIRGLPLTPVLSGSTCADLTFPSSITSAYRLLRLPPKIAEPSNARSRASVNLAVGSAKKRIWFIPGQHRLNNSSSRRRGVHRSCRVGPALNARLSSCLSWSGPTWDGEGNDPRELTRTGH